MEPSINKALCIWKTDDGYFQKPQKHRIKSDLNSTRRNVLYNLTIVFYILLQLLLTQTTTIQAVPADSRNSEVVAATFGNYSTINGMQILQRTLRDVAKSATFSSGREASYKTDNKNVTSATTADVETGIRLEGGRGGEARISEVGGLAAIVQSPSTETTFDQPQGQCLLDGEYVPETTVFCEKQVGCRAIQKTGHCCPDYKCDCQKDGKTYANGDKLVDPETPCTVCYCQGGEILCSSVTCFHRDDCTPKYIPGVCCPEYDNCPVSITSETVINTTFSATTTTTTMKPDISNDGFNQKITIKEITKPIEIRITDDNKAIPIPQMILKPATIANVTHESVSAAAPSLQIPATINTNIPATASVTMPTSTTISTFSTNDTNTKQMNENTNSDTSIKLTSVSGDNNQYPKKDNIYIDHIINGAGRNSGGGNGGNNGDGSGGGGESLKLTASVAYTTNIMDTNASITDKNATLLDGLNESENKMNNDYTDDQELELLSSLSSSSESSLSVFKNQPTSHDPNKVNIKREYLINREDKHDNNNKTNSNAHIDVTTIPINNSEATIEENENAINKKQSHLYTDSIMDTEFDTEIDSHTAGSDNIYHIVLTTDATSHLTNTMEISSSPDLLRHSTNDGLNGEHTNDDYYNSTLLLTTNRPIILNASTADSVIHDYYNSTLLLTTNRPIILNASTADSVIHDYYNSTLLLTTNRPIILNASTAGSVVQQEQQLQQQHQLHQYHQHHNDSEDDDGSLILIESNPAYPSLPEDDFSLRDVNFQLNEPDDTSDEVPSTLSTTQISRDSDKPTKPVVALDRNDDHYDGGSGLIMDDLITISSTTTAAPPTTAATVAAAATIAVTTTEALAKGSEMKEQHENVVRKENRKLSTTTTTTTTKTLAEFINSAEDSSSSEETIISNIDITNINQSYKNNDTIKMPPPRYPALEVSKEMKSTLENGSGEGQNDSDETSLLSRNETDKHKKSISTKSAEVNKNNVEVDEAVAVASGDGNNGNNGLQTIQTNDPKWNAESINSEKNQ